LVNHTIPDEIINQNEEKRKITWERKITELGVVRKKSSSCFVKAFSLVPKW